MFPFMSKFPFSNGMDDWLKQSSNQSNDIQKYIQDSIQKSMANPLDIITSNLHPNQEYNGERKDNKQDWHEPGSSNDGLDASVVETLDDVYVKIPVPDKTAIKQIKVSYTSNQVTINGYPTTNNQHTVILPAIVKRNGAKIMYRDGLLQLKIPKAIDLQFTEIEVPDLD